MVNEKLSPRTALLLGALFLAVAVALPTPALPQEQQPGGEVKKVVPGDVGLYAVLSNGEFQKITGRPTNFFRVGGWFASRTYSEIAGESAFVSVKRISTFYYRVSQEEEYFRVGRQADQTVAGTINLILTQMKVKRGRRRYEYADTGVFRGSRGIPVRHQFNFGAEEVEPGLFKLRPEPLKPGQYAFFLFARGPERQTLHAKGVGEGFIYDFAVE
jgi:hypothetical protein